jgi:hypothetical protein
MTIQELDEWFKNAPRPEMPVLLNPGVQVLDYDKFLESHFEPLRRNPDAKINVPILLRLKQMKLVIESNI